MPTIATFGTQLIKRIIGGIRSGVIFGIALTFIALVIFLLGGQRPFEVQHSSFGKVVLAYFMGAVSVGVLVGVLRPLAYSKPGAAVVGFIAAIPFAVLLRVAVSGFVPWTTVDTILVTFMCAALGAPLGVAFRDVFRDTLNK